MSAPSDDDWPEGLTEDGDKLFLKDKLLVPENRVEELIDHWHNAQLMHPGRDKMQQDLGWRFKFPPGYYAILDRYCSDCAVCRATKSPNHSTAGNPVYTAIPEAPMRSVDMDVFAMPEVTVDGGGQAQRIYRGSPGQEVQEVQDDVQAHGYSARQDRGVPGPVEWPSRGGRAADVREVPPAAHQRTGPELV